eukprot:TRINITY_DN20482_c0_g1_i1.p1 TRINITY_DN20482_c0_g1~~TRINITY_DN20482_c0_g1_i1.p1  ORF type:complete len:430 (+),score=67.11 TRINITY_DN20482_c0_g1_i1:166-1455(+)
MITQEVDVPSYETRSQRSASSSVAQGICCTASSLSSSKGCQTTGSEDAGVEDPVLQAIVEGAPSLLLDSSAVRVAAKPIAKGTFGVVRKGIYNCTEVAVKTPRKIGTDRREAMQGAAAISEELLLLQNITHEACVSFLGCMEVNGVVSLVFEFVSGGTLFHFVRRRQQSGEVFKECDMKAAKGDLADLVSEQLLLVDVAQGMRFLHAQQPAILHLDLKPENVLIEAQDPPGGKISDFGLGTLLHQHPMSLPTRRVGTPSYMAPEVASSRQYSRPADVFSFGCTCLFTVRGRHPKGMPTQADCDYRGFGDGPTFFPKVVLETAFNCVHPDARQRAAFDTICRDLKTNVSSLSEKNDSNREQASRQVKRSKKEREEREVRSKKREDKGKRRPAEVAAGSNDRTSTDKDSAQQASAVCSDARAHEGRTLLSL